MIKGASNDEDGRGATWQISWEATPHPSTGVLLGIHNASYETRQQYLRDVHAALLEPDGRDTLADEAGFPSVGFEGPGLYKGEFNPGFQTEVRESGFDFDAGYVSFALRNGQVSNDWKEKPDGQSYKARYCAAGGPDLSGAVECIRGRVNEVNTSYANQYGW